MSTPTVLLVAKAPVPGLAKTRLAAEVGDAAACELAAAALLDCLEAAGAAADALEHRAVVALTGDLSSAARGEQLRSALADAVVIPQRGTSFGRRLAHAHADAARQRPGHGTLQVGMDTPQARAGDLLAAADALAAAGAVVGGAPDGGWWLLGLREPPHAAVLTGVPMSSPQTRAATVAALHSRGVDVASTIDLRDVDVAADAEAVAAAAPDTRFAAAWRAQQASTAARAAARTAAR